MVEWPGGPEPASGVGHSGASDLVLRAGMEWEDHGHWEFGQFVQKSVGSRIPTG